MVAGLWGHIHKRYSAANNIMNENNIPEIDNLYVDINYFFFNSYSSSEGPQIIKEEAIRRSLRHLEVLFDQLRPKRLMFLAVDGALPWTRIMDRRRADTMYHERYGDDVEFLFTAKAGSDFSAEFDESVKKFIARKVSTNLSWRNVEIILSGYKTPGQGDVKIIQFMRWLRGGSKWEPNLRHCIFANNFDYVEYALALHEPYILQVERNEFCSRIPFGAEETIFSVCYISLIRGYINEEIRAWGELSLDLESSIDDWVLLVSLWGNDCVPGVPGLKGNTFLRSYSRARSKMEGPINEGGVLHLDKLEILFREIRRGEFENPFPDRENYYRDNLGFSPSSSDLIREMVIEYLKGLQYLMYKRYGKVASWSWYYPYHYAPLIDDLVNLKDISITFEADRPPDIFLSLTALQRKNRSFFSPMAFFDLVHSEEATLKRIFPVQVEVAQDGLFKIAFFERDVLSHAMEPFYEHLTDEEQGRRTIEPLLIFEYSSNSESFGQPNVSIRRLSSEGIVEGTRVVSGLYPGTVENAHVGYPFLKNLTFELKVNFHSKLTSLNVQNMFNPNDVLARPFVLADWPHLIFVKPSFLTNGFHKLVKEGTRVEQYPCSGDLTSTMDKIKYHLKSNNIVTETRYILFASVFLGYRPVITASGMVSFEPEWDPEPFPFAAETVVTECHFQLPAPPPSERFSDYISDKLTYFLLSKEHYGSKAEILSIINPNEISVTVTSYQYLPIIIQRLQFRPLRSVAQELNISCKLLTSMIYCMFVRDVSVGLNLVAAYGRKSWAKVAGCTQNGDGTWLFSSEAVSIIRQYLELFPELRRDLNKCSIDRLREMRSWIVAQNYHKKRVSQEYERLEEVEIQDLVLLLSRPFETVSTIKISVDPKDLYKPLDNLGPGPDPKATHKILDRVICVRSNYWVPLGNRGTIIGMQKSGPPSCWVFDVMFDEDIRSAGNERNIVRMSSRAFLNLDHGKRLQSMASNAQPPYKGEYSSEKFHPKWRRSAY